MLWIVFGVSLVGSMGHEFPRGGRIRFPYEGPPPPMMVDPFTGPRLYAAESQSHPVFRESSSSLEYNHTPFNPNSQKPPYSSPLADSGHYESGINKPYINQHRSQPSRPREGQFHETQPPPFATPAIPQGTKLKGILNAPPPPPTPSLSSLIENESLRHRFSGHRDPNHGERRPNNPRHHGNDGHQPKVPHHEKHTANDGHPGIVRDDNGPERQRPTHDRPPKGGERYQHQERYTAHSEKPFVYKEKTKIPFNGVKKPLFSPTFINEKPTPKAPLRTPPPPQNDDYSKPPTSDEDSDYYHSKLSEEYYSGMQNTQYAEPPVQTRAQTTKNSRPTTVNAKPGFDFNDIPFNFDLPTYGKTAEAANPFPTGSSAFPQSEEFGDFFDASLPDWMNDFKALPTESSHQGGAPKQQKQATQETKRQPFKQPQVTNYYGEQQSYEQGQNRYLSKRNPAISKNNKNDYNDGEEDEKQYYTKPQANSYSDSRAQPDSYYDTQDSTEFDFGSSSPEFNMQDFNMGSFNFGAATTKSTGTEWIPINAPDGAVPAKSYEIPAPDLSQEYFRSQSQYDSGEFQRNSSPPSRRKSPPSRRPSSRVEKSRDQSSPTVVYGARDKGRHNEGVVSASVMVKQ